MTVNMTSHKPQLFLIFVGSICALAIVITGENFPLPIGDNTRRIIEKVSQDFITNSNLPVTAIQVEPDVSSSHDRDIESIASSR